MSCEGHTVHGVSCLAAASGLPAPAVVGVRFGSSRRRTRSCAGTYDNFRHRSRRHDSDQYAHIQRQPRVPRFASRPLRVELELRAGIVGLRLLGYPPAPNRPAPRSGPLGSRLDGGVLRRAANRRPHRARNRWTAGAPVGPPVLSGHGFDAPGQVVLGPSTLNELHKRVGDSVIVRTGFSAPIRLRIVGTATMPTAGQAGALHPTMGSGAWLSYTLIPVSVRNPFHSALAGPQAIFVRLQADANPKAAMRAVEQITQDPSVAADRNGVDLACAAASSDRRLPINRYNPGDTCRRSCCRGRDCSWSHPRCGSATASTDNGPLEGAGLHPVAVGGDCRLAVECHGHHWVVIGVPLGVLLGRFLWVLFDTRSMWYLPLAFPSCRSHLSPSVRFCLQIWLLPYRVALQHVLRQHWS